MPDPTETLMGRLVEARKRGRKHYIPHLNPDAFYTRDAVNDLTAGINPTEAFKVCEEFRRGWIEEKTRLAQKRMHEQNPQLRQLLQTRASLQSIVNKITETVDQIEKEHPDA